MTLPIAISINSDTHFVSSLVGVEWLTVPLYFLVLVTFKLVHCKVVVNWDWLNEMALLKHNLC